MTSPERPREPLATPAQIRKIYGNVSAQTTLNGVSGENGNYLGLSVDVVPSEVAVHMPTHESDVSHVGYAVHLEEYTHDLLTVPESPEDISVVRFSRTEHVSRDQGYITDVSYYVTRDKSGAWLERRITGSVKESRAREGLKEIDKEMQVSLEAIAPAVRAEREARQIVKGAELQLGAEQERALGLSSVTAAEAQQVIHFLESIPTKQP